MYEDAWSGLYRTTFRFNDTRYPLLGVSHIAVHNHCDHLGWRHLPLDVVELEVVVVNAALRSFAIDFFLILFRDKNYNSFLFLAIIVGFWTRPS